MELTDVVYNKYFIFVMLLWLIGLLYFFLSNINMDRKFKRREKEIDKEYAKKAKEFDREHSERMFLKH